VLLSVLFFQIRCISELSQFCRKVMSNFIFMCPLGLILMVVVGGHGGKFVEKDAICFRRYKCNCSRLCTTVWVSFCLNQELRIPVSPLYSVSISNWIFS